MKIRVYDYYHEQERAELLALNREYRHTVKPSWLVKRMSKFIEADSKNMKAQGI